MRDNQKLQLVIVSQAKQLVEVEADSVTAPTQTGEITVLPGHVPLLSPLQTGELRYLMGKEEHSVVVTKGFIDVGSDSIVTVIVDEAVADRDISLQKAQEAVEQARSIIVSSRDQRELLLAEASLKRALLEIKVAQKSKRTTL